MSSDSTTRSRQQILADYIQDMARIGSWELDTDTWEAEWSKGTFDIFGLPYNTPVGRYMTYDHFPPEDRARLEAAINRCVETFEPYHLRLQFIDAHGVSKWVEAYGEPSLEDGRLHKLMGTFRDVTEEETRKRELEFIIRGTGIGVWRLNLITDELVWDDNMYALYGVDPKDFSGAYDAWEKTLHPDYKAQAIQDLQDAIAGKTEFDTTFSIIAGAGEVRHILARATIERDPQGTPVMVTGINVDQTTEINNQRTLEQLAMRLSEAVRATNTGLWEWDMEQNTVHYSEEWKSQIGYGGDEISDDFEEWRQRVHPDDLARTMAPLGLSELADKPSYEAEFRFRHRDGSYRWILSHASLLKDNQGKPIKMVGSHIDVTERKKMEQALLRSQKMEALGTLAGGIAHDFNNLLTPILGYAELLKRKLAHDSKEATHAHKIADTAERARELVKKILLISRDSVEHTESVALPGLVDEVLSVVSASAPKNVRIATETEADIPDILADPSGIYQVVLNLCTNAIQAMSDGGDITIKVAMASHPATVDSAHPVLSDDVVQLTVSDTGSGIGADALEHIFEPFFTTKSKGERRGTGLGLSIVTSIVSAHGGWIDVDSKPGEGTTFIVNLPVRTARSDAADNPTRTELVAGTGEVLLIDDEQEVADLASALLGELGYRVRSFTDADEALRVFEREPGRYALVLTDYEMPAMLGSVVIKRVKSQVPKLPVVLLTGYSNMVSDGSTAEMGCDAVLAKPYDLQSLSSAIAAAKVQATAAVESSLN